MPYIKQNFRDLIDDQIDILIDCFKERINNTQVNGAANYVITRVILGCLKPTAGWNYESLSDVIKTLECSKQEILRRLVGPYEDGKIIENGDVEEFLSAKTKLADIYGSNFNTNNPITGP